MDFESLKGLFLEKLQKRDFKGFKGGNLSLYIPIQEGLLNSLIEYLISTSKRMQDFEYLAFNELDNNRFLVVIKHRKLNKTVRCEIQDIEYNSKSEPILNIDFLEGLKFYEKIALDSAMVIHKGWKKFKSLFKDEPDTTKKQNLPIDISSSGLSLNLAKVLSHLELDYLNPLIAWKQISTNENKLIIDLSIKI